MKKRSSGDRLVDAYTKARQDIPYPPRGPRGCPANIVRMQLASKFFARVRKLLRETP